MTTRPDESVVHGSKARRDSEPPPSNRPESPSVVRLSELPSVDRLLRLKATRDLIAEHGHSLVAQHARELLEALRESAARGCLAASAIEADGLLVQLRARVLGALMPRMRAVLNLTGTVIHTNLGRALLAPAALQQIQALMGQPGNLEFDLDGGGRGDRDSLVDGLLCTLCEAEAATVVNNNAAAVLLMLAGLAKGREVVVSRGELVEIGGAFRMPDVMAAAGVRLREVGTTNRTHLRDYEAAIGPRTALLMKVHTSNYAVQGYTSAVSEAELAPLARARGLPLISDLGSGSLIDLTRHGLPAEPTPQAMLAAGCDLVSFSGDKLLGGPQAGLIVGRRDLIARLKRAPLKRALRLSKLPMAALEATLRLYLRPERLTQDLPTLSLLVRPQEAIKVLAEALQPMLAQALKPHYDVEVVLLQSQIGSGSLPVEHLPSAGLALRPHAVRGRGGRALERLAAALRGLSLPVIGRVADGCLLLDLRCLEDPQLLTQSLDELRGALADQEARAQ